VLLFTVAGGVMLEAIMLIKLCIMLLSSAQEIAFTFDPLFQNYATILTNAVDL